MSKIERITFIVLIAICAAFFTFMAFELATMPSPPEMDTAGYLAVKQLIEIGCLFIAAMMTHVMFGDIRNVNKTHKA